ncbi:hypothetical protein [Streptomyces collinus]|uniref:hypothetical protein n=1 Tax=Streptomyces collinus TaxID=42684 RepID=UPI00362933C3
MAWIASPAAMGETRWRWRSHSGASTTRVTTGKTWSSRVDRLLESFLVLARTQHGESPDSALLTLGHLALTALTERADDIAAKGLTVRVQPLAEVIAEGLCDQGMAVDVAHDGLDAAAKLDVNAYDVVLRTRALARRRPTARSRTLSAAGFELDPMRSTVSRDGHQLELSVKEFAVLEALLNANPYRTVAPAVPPDSVAARGLDPSGGRISSTTGAGRA